MEMMIERRCDLEGRVPMHLPIEVELSGYDERFEADAVDVSTGGLAMRAPCLPDVGTHLACRFAVVHGGPAVSALGEVVWARTDGPRRGEFGVRFVELMPEQKALVAEMLAEQAAHPERVADHASTAAGNQAAGNQAAGNQPAGDQAAGNQPAGTPSFEQPATSASEHGGAAGTSEVTLDLGHAAISGLVTAHSQQGAQVEQPLDLLSLGQGLWMQGDGGERRRAHISGVSLRVNGKTPTLAVQVAFDDGTLDDPAPEHDTTPDLEPPEWPVDMPAQQRPTVNEFVADSGFVADSIEGAVRDYAAHNPPIAPAGGYHQPLEQAAVQTRQPEASPSTSNPTALSRLGAVPQQAALSLSDVQRMGDGQRTVAVQTSLDLSDRAPMQAQPTAIVPDDVNDLDGRSGASPQRSGRPDASMQFELEDDGVDVEVEPPRSRLSGAQFRAALDASPLFREGGPWLRWVAHAARLSEQGRRLWVRLKGGLDTGMGSGRTAALGRLDALITRPKRRTAGRPKKASAAAAIWKRLPVVLIALLAVGGLSLLVYALSPTEDPLLAGQSATPADGPAVQQAAAVTEPTAAVVLPAVGGGQGVVVSARGSVGPGKSPPESAQPTAAGAQTKGARSGPAFGAARVPGAKRFALRMTEPVTKLQGTADAGGFTVVIPGSLSLDPAGPFAAQHGAIQRSMILNKNGNRSELTIRFKNGLKPPYRVQASGTTLEIMVGLP